MSDLSSEHAERPYEIRLAGHLEARWADQFSGMTITLLENGETLLSGLILDQAALHGFFRKLRDLGLPLISVNRMKSNRIEDHSVKENAHE